jgi:hypothetical protein
MPYIDSNINNYTKTQLKFINLRRTRLLKLLQQQQHQQHQQQQQQLKRYFHQ